jgi:flagellar basal body-associated protein FliL
MAEKISSEPTPASAEAKKGLPIKTIAVVAGLMVAEAVAVVMVVGMTGPRVQPAAAHELHEGQADLDASVEVALLEEKFQNMQTGRAWIWDTEVVLKLKARNQEFVAKQLEKRAAEIKEGVSMIFRRAPHSQLKEPGLETMNRQLTAYLNEILGKDADGKDRLERVVIPKCKGFPTD